VPQYSPHTDGESRLPDVDASTYEYCERESIMLYGGGQTELSVGRGQLQLLAAMFHPDAPNDIAPPGTTAPTSRRLA